MAKTYRNWRGVSDLVAAEVIKDTAEAYETGEVFDVAGLAELSRTTENSSETVYYDNTPSLVVDSVGADTLTCSVAAIDLDVLAKLTGQYYDENLGMFIEGERESKYFAIGYKTQRTDGSTMVVWRYKCSCSIPDSTHSTKTGGTESSGQEITLTGIMTTHKFAKTGKSARAIQVDVNDEKVDTSTFFEAVTTPDTLQAKA